MAQVTLTINGRNYGITCDDGQEQRVMDLGHYVDERIKALSKAGAASNENVEPLVDGAAQTRRLAGGHDVLCHVVVERKDDLGLDLALDRARGDDLDEARAVAVTGMVAALQRIKVADRPARAAPRRRAKLFQCLEASLVRTEEAVNVTGGHGPSQPLTVCLGAVYAAIGAGDFGDPGVRPGEAVIHRRHAHQPAFHQPGQRLRIGWQHVVCAPF